MPRKPAKKPPAPGGIDLPIDLPLRSFDAVRFADRVTFNTQDITYTGYTVGGTTTIFSRNAKAPRFR